MKQPVVLFLLITALFSCKKEIIEDEALKMKRFAILLVFVFTALISCNKLDIENGTPTCVVEKIKSFNKSSICDDAEVSEYLFQGKTVYVFNSSNCFADLTSDVIDSECNKLGFLGGESGITRINGEEFSHATFVKTIWKK